MIKVGMIGGFSPESTLDYYRSLIEVYRNNTKDNSYPEIIIYSMDITILMKLVGNKQWDELIHWLLEGIEVLHKGGAEFGFISANTPHIVFDELKELSPIPLISIVDTTCEHMKKMGIKKVGLFGTKFTMESDFFKKVCEKNGIQVFVPNKEERIYIHNKLITEIQLGKFLDETRNGLVDIIKRMIHEHSIEGVILGCTELPLILTHNETGVPFFNTTEIHVESIIKHYLESIKHINL